MSAPVFRARTGAAAAEKASRGSFEAVLLPDAEKESLCVQLLGELGVQVVRRNTDGELFMSCPIPGGRHKNGDRNASASLNYKKLTFNCFSCGSHGGFLWFVAVCRGEDVDDARDWLGTSTGTGGQAMALDKLLAFIDAALTRRAGPEPIPCFDPTVLDPWDLVHPYMTEVRGIPESTLDEFRVGYAEDYPMGPKTDPQPRIVIPLFWRGDLVGWQARRLRKSDEPKYKNSPGFPRDRVLYGPPAGDRVLVVESPQSKLRHHHHRPELCATFGAQVTDDQARLLHRYRRVVLWPDPDPAGWGSARDLAARLERHTQVFVVPSPYDVDPAELDDDTVDRLWAEQIPYAIWEPPSSLVPWRP